MDRTGSLSDCDIYHVHSGVKRKCTPGTIREMTVVVDLLYTDVMRPINLAAKGDYVYVSNFTDDSPG